MCLDRYLKVPPLMLVTRIGIGRENLCMNRLFVGLLGKGKSKECYYLCV